VVASDWESRQIGGNRMKLSVSINEQSGNGEGVMQNSDNCEIKIMSY